ncbi:MAG: YraN family protein [Rickettsiales bacterium]|nr:YraN family protein [Rickettsiales bacterium]
MINPSRIKRQAAYQRGLSQERIAAWLLRAKGYRILAQRYRSPYGEIDLIARRGRVLIFIEIKARASLESAAFAITPHQQSRIRQTAEHFLAQHPRYLPKCQFRFDAVLCVPRRWPKHLKDAWR